MRCLTAALYVLVTTLPVAAYAQRVNSDKIFPNGSTKATQSSVPTKLADGDSKNIFALVMNSPVTFSKLERDSTATWRMGAAITGGVAASFVLGKATYQGKTTTIDPWIFFGVGLNTGVKEQLDRSVRSTLTTSAHFGVSQIALAYYYDLLDSKKYLGLSLKTSLITDLNRNAFIPFKEW